MTHYTRNASGALSRPVNGADRPEGGPRKVTSIVPMASGEFGRLTGNAIDGFTIASVHPTMEDAERSEIGAMMGDAATPEAVDRVFAERWQWSRTSGDVPISERRFILWNTKNGAPPRGEDGRINTGGVFGELERGNVFLNGYAKYPRGFSDKSLEMLHVGGVIFGVKFSLSNEIGFYNVYRVK